MSDYYIALEIKTFGLEMSVPQFIATKFDLWYLMEVIETLASIFFLPEIAPQI